MSGDAPVPGRFDLDDAFARQEGHLRGLLGLTGAATHPTVKGDGAEEPWRGFLREILPGRYGVVTGHVIDSNGGQSGQIDVIVHDAFYSPLIFSVGPHSFVPAESVYAVFEVKPELTKATLEAAEQKAESVRALTRTSAPIPNQFDKNIRKDMARFHILGGLLTTSTGWADPAASLNTHVRRQTAGRAIDLGCAIDRLAFAIGRRHDDRAHVEAIDFSAVGRTLAFFAVRLLHMLQQQGTVGAISYPAYYATVVAGLDE